MSRGMTVRDLLEALRRNGWKHTAGPAPEYPDAETGAPVGDGWDHRWTRTPADADAEAYAIRLWLREDAGVWFVSYEPEGEPRAEATVSLGGEVVDGLGPAGLQKLAVALGVLPGGIFVMPQFTLNLPTFDHLHGARPALDAARVQARIQRQRGR